LAEPQIADFQGLQKLVFALRMIQYIFVFWAP